MRIAVTLFFLLFKFLSGCSQAFSLKECIELALTNSPDIQILLTQQKIAETQYDQKKLQFLPRLSSGSLMSYSVGRSIDPYTNQFETFPIKAQSLSLTGEIDLFTGFNRILSLHTAEEQIRMTQYEVNHLRNEITKQVLYYFKEILVHSKTIRFLSDEMDITTRQFATLENLFANRMILESELYDLKLSQLDLELRITQAYSQLQASMLALQQLTGTDQYEEIRIDTTSFSMIIYDPEALKKEAAIGEVLANDPVLKRFHIEKQVAHREVAMTRNLSLPSLNLNGNISTQYSSLAPDSIPVLNNPGEFEENTYLNQVNNNLNQRVSLQLSIPIFNRLNQTKSAQIARLRSSIVEKNLQKHSQEVRMEAENLVNHAISAKKIYMVARERKLASEKTAELKENQYQNGRLSQYEYLLSRMHQVEAGISEIESFHNYWYQAIVLQLKMYPEWFR